MHKPKRVAIVGAGPAGLMAAGVLSAHGVAVDVYEAKPSVGRKFLMAGKGGLNISHDENLDAFMQRYDQPEWLAPMVRAFNADDIRAWMTRLGVASFVGSSGRIFPAEMKAAPLLRHWLLDLKQRGVRVHCRQYWRGFSPDGGLIFDDAMAHADAVVLAMGGGSWPSLGADGAWVDILSDKGVAIAPLLASNCGFKVAWSPFMLRHAGSALKNIVVSVGDKLTQSELMLTQYGVEGGAVYALSGALREQILRNDFAVLQIDLLPHISEAALVERLQVSAKHSVSSVWRKARIDALRADLIREVLPQADWGNAQRVAAVLKRYPVTVTDMQPMSEAISTAGGVMRSALDEHLMLHALPRVFCCGEMLDWDAPTGGYLLTACLASGRFAAHGVLRLL